MLQSVRRWGGGGHTALQQRTQAARLCDSHRLQQHLMWNQYAPGLAGEEFDRHILAWDLVPPPPFFLIKRKLDRGAWVA